MDEGSALKLFRLTRLQNTSFIVDCARGRAVNETWNPTNYSVAVASVKASYKSESLVASRKIAKQYPTILKLFILRSSHSCAGHNHWVNVNLLALPR